MVQKIPVGDGLIAIEERGSGQPLVLLHGDGMDMGEFNEYIESLTENFLVVRIDLRGFGQSAIPGASPYSFYGDILVVMDTLGIKSAHLIGHSLGAAVAIDIAITSPNRVSSMVLFSPGLGGYGFSAEVLSGIRRCMKLAQEGNLNGAREAWLDYPLMESNDPGIAEKVRMMVNRTSGYRWYGTNKPVRLEPPAFERLGSIRCPVLILLGEHDAADMEAIARIIAKEVKLARIRRIPGGHLAVMESASLAVPLIRKWIAQGS
jgi:3-oxoadipate enol-lactonase